MQLMMWNIKYIVFVLFSMDIFDCSKSKAEAKQVKSWDCGLYCFLQNVAKQVHGHFLSKLTSNVQKKFLPLMV